MNSIELFQTCTVRVIAVTLSTSCWRDCCGDPLPFLEKGRKKRILQIDYVRLLGECAQQHVTLYLSARNWMLSKIFELQCLREQRLTALEAEALLVPKMGRKRGKRG